LLYICIPAYNEGPTIGVLLWRIRKVLQDYPRQYEIIVYDDASSDSTREILEPYTKVLPLTVLGTAKRVGYASALRALLVEVNSRTRYPRRDAVIVMQGDFTDQPESIPDLVKLFEGGADIVVGQRVEEKMDKQGRKLARLARFATRPLIAVPNIVDPFASFRLYRISVLRELLKTTGDDLLSHGDGWAANAELLMRALSLARRVQPVSLEQRYDVRLRESRVRPVADAMRLVQFGWSARKWNPQQART
jgi:glycosyltransferase involved in cell wall biosynthesis